MSTQPRSDLKSTAPARVSRNAMNPLGAKDLTETSGGAIGTDASMRPSPRNILTRRPLREAD